MARQTSENWFGCPFRFGANVLGDGWSLLILRDLIFREARHYGDFVAAGEGISTNILADRLQRLEAEGVISKQQDPDRAVRVIYRLTEKGRGLVPILMAIIDWSEQWDDRTEVPAAFIKAYREDRSGFVASVVDGLELAEAKPGEGA